MSEEVSVNQNANYGDEIVSMLVDSKEKIIDTLGKSFILTDKRLYYRVDAESLSASSAKEQVMDLSRVRDNTTYIVNPKKKPLNNVLCNSGIFAAIGGFVLGNFAKLGLGWILFIVGLVVVGYAIYLTKPDMPYVEFKVEYRGEIFSKRFGLLEEERAREFNKNLIRTKEQLGFV